MAISSIASAPTLSLGARFINLFQNRAVAITTLFMLSIPVGVVGIFCLFTSNDNKEFKKIYKLSSLIFSSALLPMILNVIVAKCLRIPLSWPLNVALGLAGTSTGLGTLIIIEKYKK